MSLISIKSLKDTNDREVNLTDTELSLLAVVEEPNSLQRLVNGLAERIMNDLIGYHLDKIAPDPQKERHGYDVSNVNRRVNQRLHDSGILCLVVSNASQAIGEYDG